MRLLAEILIIGAMIFFGWTTLFKDQVAQGNTTITNKLHGVGSKLQKHQDPSVRPLLAEPRLGSSASRELIRHTAASSKIEKNAQTIFDLSHDLSKNSFASACSCFSFACDIGGLLKAARKVCHNFIGRRILPLLLSTGQWKSDRAGREDAHEHAGDFKEWL